MNPSLTVCLELAGLELAADQIGQLDALGKWLRTEAVPKGGLGPSEGSRIEYRHLADSVVFASGWATPPSQCWDLGSGSGLPGLVLSIVWPACRVRLIDRSTRRMDLARRGARVVGVEVDATIASIESLQGPVEAVVSRAAMSALDLAPHLRRILSPGGMAVVSGSGAPVPGYSALPVPARILDHSPRLLMMRAQ